MKFIAHLLFAAFLAAFAASSVAYAAESGDMAAAMVLSDDAMEMADCTPCGGSGADGSAVACDIECGASGFAAVLAPQTRHPLHASRDVFRPAVAQTSGGLNGPPAKQPPRTLI